jgi:hypothetical protein
MISRRSPPRTQLKSQSVSVGPDNEARDPALDNSRWEGPVDLGRLAWLITTGTLVVGVIILALKRDWGYAGVTLAVAISAGINLF